MYMNHSCAWCTQRPEGDARSPGTGVTDACEQLDVGAGEQQELVRNGDISTILLSML